MRLSVCAFYIRVEALYTLKHHPAESVTSDFFIADPIYKVFRDHYDQLVAAMTSPTALIPVLYSKYLISPADKTNLTTLTGVGSIDIARKLLDTVEATMKAAPKAAQVLREFYLAVDDQPALRHVANRIRTALGEY